TCIWDGLAVFKIRKALNQKSVVKPTTLVKANPHSSSSRIELDDVGLPVSEYYHKLNSLWREFKTLTKLPDCTCVARNEVIDHDKMLKLMQFLMGLDDVYQPIRSSILTKEILLEVKDAFVIVSREESHRRIPSSSVKTDKPQASAFVARQSDNNRNRNNNWSNNGFEKGRVLGTSSEIAGLYLFDKEYNKSAVSNNSKFFACHVSKEALSIKQLVHIHPSRIVLLRGNIGSLSFVLNGKSPFSLVYNKEPNLSHLRSFGCLCFAAIVKRSDKFFEKSEKCVLIGYASSKKAYKLFNLENKTVMFSRDVKFYKTIFPYKMSVQLDVEHKDFESEVTNLNFFDFVESEPKTKIPISPDDEEEGPLGRDVNVHQDDPGNDDLNIATHIDDNRNYEGNVGTNEQAPRFQNLFENQTEEVSPELRRSNRPSKLPIKLNEFVLDNRVKHGLNRYANHTFLDAESSCFISNLNKSLEPSSFEEDSKDPNWICAMNDEMNALYENDTWVLADLPYGRKPIGTCRSVLTPLPENIILAHKESEKDKFLVNITSYQRLVGKLIYLRSDISYDVHCLSQHMHAPLKSHFDIALRLLKYLKLAPGNGIQYLKRQNVFDIKAFSNFDWAKCPITRRSVSGYYVFVNGCLVSWKSKKQATLCKSSAEAKYRSMAAATYEIMWIVKIMKDLNIGNLLPAELHCDNKSAMQIAANLVMHEKTKHFDLDVHLVREKVSSGLIKTVKVDSKDNVVDTLTKALGSFQHGHLTKRFGIVNLFGS
ncbi:ribonuclease H-like domain-containing protein, partial [Tanacetum coccineum]